MRYQKNFNRISYQSTVPFICINKNFHFRSPLTFQFEISVTYYLFQSPAKPVNFFLTKALFTWGKTPHLPGPVLRGEIPPSNKILCSFISRLHEEHNTTGIVKSHLTRGEISPRWGKIFPYKRNTTGMVRWIESIRWFSLVSSSWFHGRETLLHLTSQPRGWQVRWKISYKQWLKSTSPLSPGSGRWGVFPHINRA